MPDEPVNCGRCAHLWNRSQPGFGVCASAARAHQIGKIRSTVALDATCEHAQLSAKFDPDFFPALRLARRGWIQPSCTQPQTTETDARQNQDNRPQDRFQD